MSFQQGLSGLNAAAQQLDVIGNNIANSSTVGFKTSRNEFADVYATATFGASDLKAGLGAQTTDVAQQFTQGGISVTNNPMDVAISGDGFFRLSGVAGNTYTRNGQFRLDKDGYMVSNTGQNVTGYTQLSLDSSLNVVGTSTLGNIRVDLDDINATATSNLGLKLNLDAASTDKLLASFDPLNDPTSYHYSTTVTAYDSLGNDHSLSFYFVKFDDGDGATVNTWATYAFLDGAAPANQLDLGGTIYHTLEFTNSGGLVNTLPVSNVAVPISGAADLQIAMNFTGTSQFSGASGINSITQDGFQSGSLVGLSIGADGVISGRYSNGVTKPLQQLVMTTFRNPQALVPIGNNQWVPTIEAGSETINKPGEGVAGQLQSGAVEDSNTDLTAELVNLIVAQRMYQANAQTISAQSQILQTLVNLR